MNYRSSILLVGCLALLLLSPASRSVGQGLEYVRSHYTKYEHRIPMRDGKRLFTSVYIPKDRSQTYPILYRRTPYSVAPYGADQYPNDLGPSPLFGKSGYIFVYQDVRGRWMSEGEFVNVRPQLADGAAPTAIDESTDTWDTIQWLVTHLKHHNGQVGMWGISYPGFYAAAGAINAHPALKATSPQAPVIDWFIGDDWHHNGALMLTHVFNFMSTFGRPRPEPTKKFIHKFDHETPDGYDFFLRLGPLSNANDKHFKNDVAFWNEVMQHGVYDDFWKVRNLRPHLKNIRPAVLTVGGWFDAENLFGALETYRAIEANSPGADHRLVMGPWTHGGWRGDGESLGPVSFNDKTAIHFREQIELPFFEYYLKNKTEAALPKVSIFETGTNQWQHYDAWPPQAAQPKSLYFHPAGKLAWQPPAEAAAPGYDEYVSDPAKPVPYIERVETGMATTYMTADQRFAGRRTDVLVYQTDELESDVTIVGPLEAALTVSTSGTDSDWIVKLIDVYPSDFPDPEKNPAGDRLGGYQQIVRGDVMRGKFRNSFEQPAPFVPHEPAAVSFKLPDVGHTFRTGHRIMIQVQSTWFPLVDRNPQTFVDIYSAKESDFRKATQRVYHTPAQPSRLNVLVLDN